MNSISLHYAKEAFRFKSVQTEFEDQGDQSLKILINSYRFFYLLNELLKDIDQPSIYKIY